MVVLITAVFLAIAFAGTVWWSSALVVKLHKDVSHSTARAVAEVVSEVAGEVAREVGQAIRGPLPTPEDEETAAMTGVQEQAFVSAIPPWESWGEEQDGQGDVRYNPDPTDKLIPDDDDGSDLSRRAVNVPPGYAIPTHPNMAGENFGLENNGG